MSNLYKILYPFISNYFELSFIFVCAIVILRRRSICPRQGHSVSGSELCLLSFLLWLSRPELLRFPVSRLSFVGIRWGIVSLREFGRSTQFQDPNTQPMYDKNLCPFRVTCLYWSEGLCTYPKMVRKSLPRTWKNWGVGTRATLLRDLSTPWLSG